MSAVPSPLHLTLCLHEGSRGLQKHQEGSAKCLGRQKRTSWLWKLVRVLQIKRNLLSETGARGSKVGRAMLRPERVWCSSALLIPVQVPGT